MWFEFGFVKIGKGGLGVCGFKLGCCYVFWKNEWISNSWGGC